MSNGVVYDTYRKHLSNLACVACVRSMSTTSTLVNRTKQYRHMDQNRYHHTNTHTHTRTHTHTPTYTHTHLHTPTHTYTHPRERTRAKLRVYTVYSSSRLRAMLALVVTAVLTAVSCLRASMTTSRSACNFGEAKRSAAPWTRTARRTRERSPWRRAEANSRAEVSCLTWAFK